MDSSVNLLADMVPSEDMLPSPSNTFEDEEDDAWRYLEMLAWRRDEEDDDSDHLDETPMELDDN